MQAGGFEIWRRVLVAEDLSFQKLHGVIQAAFDWQDTHKHECFVLAEPVEFGAGVPVESLERKAVIVGDDGARGAGSEDAVMLNENETVLSDVFADADMCVYHYDFTDNWFHVIRLEKVVEDLADLGELAGGQAKLLDRCGVRPPEGVGGVSGFEGYVNVIADKKHPFREQMMDWVEGLEERDLTIEEINRNMEKIF